MYRISGVWIMLLTLRVRLKPASIRAHQWAPKFGHLSLRALTALVLTPAALHYGAVPADSL